MAGVRGEQRLGGLGAGGGGGLLLSFPFVSLFSSSTCPRLPLHPLWCGKRRTVPGTESVSFVLGSKEWKDAWGGGGEQTGRELLCESLNPRQAVVPGLLGPFRLSVKGRWVSPAALAQNRNQVSFLCSPVGPPLRPRGREGRLF